MKKSYLLFIAMLLWAACSTVKKYDTGTLTDQQVLNYIEVYKKLKDKAPEILEAVNKDPENKQTASEQFNVFEDIIKEGGIESYPHFVYLNAKIGSIFSIMQATNSMEQFKEMTESGDKSFEQAIAEVEKQLANPDVPEETKVELRKTLEELKRGQSEVKQNWEENSKWANLVLDKVNDIAGLIVNEGDVEVVKRHEKEIMEAYMGFPMPELPDNKFPEIKFE